MDKLKLIALDAEDLAVISAHLQDAVVKVGDLAYQPRECRFASILNRFDWGRAVTDPKSGFERRQCALRFERVRSARLMGIDLARTSDVLALLAIQFEGAGEEDPAGIVTLQFAAGAAIRLELECIEAELRDLGPAWSASSRPRHPEDDPHSPGNA